MKKIFKSVTAAALAACVCVSMSACGNSEEKDLENRLNALDGMSAEDAERELEQGLNALDNTGGNSASANEVIDPFENLSVAFFGTAPKSTVTISGGNSLCKYTADKKSSLRNGDTVTVTAEFKDAQNNKVLTETEKEYTVSGLSYYAAKLDDIPAEALDKIRSQSKDVITGQLNAEPINKMKVDSFSFTDSSFELDGMDFAGYYFLAGKEGFDVSPCNKMYCAYKVRYFVTAYEYDESRVAIKRNMEEYITDYQEFYNVCEINDIIIHNDGTCSFDLRTDNLTYNRINGTVHADVRFCNSFGYKLYGNGYYWRGHSDTDSMFRKCVTEKIDNYNYETTVE